MRLGKNGLENPPLHGKISTMLKRHLQPLVERSLADFPVVLITGARQVGKSTLAQALITPDWRAAYLTLDDRTVLDAALTDPEGFLAANPTPLVAEEMAGTASARP
jgi:hypothetical protein